VKTTERYILPLSFRVCRKRSEKKKTALVLEGGNNFLKHPIMALLYVECGPVDFVCTGVWFNIAVRRKS
jgi:hypothetical protein